MEPSHSGGVVELARRGGIVIEQCLCCNGVRMEIGPFCVRFAASGFEELAAVVAQAEAARTSASRRTPRPKNRIFGSRENQS